MNKGTKEGLIEEKLFTQNLNKKQDLSLWKELGLNSNNHWAVHVIYQKMGEINCKKIWPKADLYIAKGVINKEDISNLDYYINESVIKELKLIPIPKSGISVKRCDSTNYQIMKMGPLVFKKLFGTNLLAAGASIYDKNPDEFIKNKAILNGWNINESDFKLFFSNRLNESVKSLNDKKSLTKIKKFSNKEIENVIINNKIISDFIFLGIGNFNEPYTASWFLEREKLRKATSIPFSVTTGSGRSKGVYTIVIKPKNL